MDELRSRIVAMTKAGVFGPPGNWPYVRDNNGDQTIGLQFASEIEFFRIGLDKSGSKIGAQTPAEASECDYQEIFIAVKTQLKGSKERQFTNMDAMFFNEVFMYKTLIHSIGAEDFGMFPKCFYAEACAGNNPARDIVITEDVKQRGFRTVYGDTLDLQHLKLALKRLGRFHGLSYRAKRMEPNDFAKVADLKPIKFDVEFSDLLSATTSRGINRLAGRDGYSKLAIFQSKLREGRDVLRFLKTPQEPFAVICHGEFHKSNMMFSYDSRGDVEDVVFFDLQMSLYSDPSTDISFLLHMNASQTTRDEKWDEMLSDYWTGVTSIVDPGFDFDEFMSNFRNKCVYGYLPTSIFLPLAMDDAEANESIEDFLSHPIQERIELMEEMGGDRATEALAEILKDLVDRGYVDAFLEHYSAK